MPGSPPAAAPGLRRPWFWALLIALVALDLWSKAWAHEWAAGGERAVLGSWLSIQRVFNPGGLFGMGQTMTLPLTLLRAGAVLLILWLVGRQPRANRRGVFTLALLCAGAAGNLYDNLSVWAPWPGNGLVRDFVKVDLGFWPFHPWPLFNLADSCIVLGFLLLLTGVAQVRLRPDGPARPGGPEGRA